MIVNKLININLNNLLFFCDVKNFLFFFLAAKEEFLKTKLPNSVLSKIWKLADVDDDGVLDSDEFALAMYLVKIKLEGSELPSTLPKHLIPPSKHEEPIVKSVPNEE